MRIDCEYISNFIIGFDVFCLIFFKNFSFSYVNRLTKIFLILLDVFESAKQKSNPEWLEVLFGNNFDHAMLAIPLLCPLKTP